MWDSFNQHNAEQFERLLREMCADEEGDLLIESAVKGVPKVFVVSALVSVTPAQPFVFRNYQVRDFGECNIMYELLFLYSSFKKYTLFENVFCGFSWFLEL